MNNGIALLLFWLHKIFRICFIYSFMKSLDQYTRMGPPARIQKLLDFNKRLKQCEASNDFLENWQTKLDDRLVEVPARLLQNEKIMWGNGASS